MKRQSAQSPDSVPHGSAQTVLMIIGMRDNSCRERLVDVLEKLDGVTDVQISLMRARAVVTHQPSCDPADLVWAIVNAGFGAALADG